ncbi:MAG: ribonuclease Y [Ruminococcaceae bacterium]|nr:ribonuclease Y [Oscillospiraceae bacterium]
MTTTIITALITFVVAGFLGVVVGVQIRKRVAEAEIGSAEQEAKRIIDEGKRIAETKKKEALIEAKEEILKNKNEADREIKERRNEVSRLERRCVTREETLDKKIESLERKEETLNRKIKEAEEKNAEAEAVKEAQIRRLEEISGLSGEEAKSLLVAEVEETARFEAAQKLAEIESEFKEEAENKARNIISLAIARVASDHVTEATVSVVPLPNDDMKGRIIGREGRNIRTVEQLTGVDLIIDDTPEAITLSCFDPVRREIARLTLEKLITDGRIHPTRIEEMVEKSKKEVETQIKQAGDRAIFETGIHGINNELVKILGRLRFRTSYGQNVLDHSIEVSYIAGIIADELGVDGTLARRAGLLHDIGKAMTQEIEGSHVQIGVDLAKKYKENKDVLHAIEAHHNDVEPRSLVALIVQAADAISAARPGARRENIENFIKRLQKLEEIASSFPGVEKSFAIQAGREVRVMVKPEEVSDERMILVARDIAKKIEEELKYPGQIKVNIIRESRASEYAK